MNIFNLYCYLVVHAILIHTSFKTVIILFIFMCNVHWLDKDMFITIAGSSTGKGD